MAGRRSRGCLSIRTMCARPGRNRSEQEDPELSVVVPEPSPGLPSEVRERVVSTGCRGALIAARLVEQGVEARYLSSTSLEMRIGFARALDEVPGEAGSLTGGRSLEVQHGPSD